MNARPVAVSSIFAAKLLPPTFTTMRWSAAVVSAISHIDTIVHYRYFSKKEQLTDYSANIIDYSYQPRDHKVAMLIADQNGEKFYMSPILRGHEQSLSQLSPYAQKRLLTELIQKEKDTVVEPISKHRFSASYRYSRRKRQNNSLLGNDSTFVVQQDAVPPKPRPKDTIQRPNNYYVELFADQLMSQIDFTSMNYSYQPFTGGNAPIYLNSGFNVFLGSKAPKEKAVKLDADTKDMMNKN